MSWGGGGEYPKTHVPGLHHKTSEKERKTQGIKRTHKLEYKKKSTHYRDQDSTQGLGLSLSF